MKLIYLWTYTPGVESPLLKIPGTVYLIKPTPQGLNLHFYQSNFSTIPAILEISSLENANHFLPTSFKDAPILYNSSLSKIRNLSWEFLKVFIVIFEYWRLYFSKLAFRAFEIVWVYIDTKLC